MNKSDYDLKIKIVSFSAYMFRQISLKLCESANKQITSVPDPPIGIKSKQTNTYTYAYIISIHVRTQSLSEHKPISVCERAYVAVWVQS